MQILAARLQQWPHAMTAPPITPRFPLAETLAEFFRMDRGQRVHLSMVAQLLGTSTEQVQELRRAEGDAVRLDSVEWAEAAEYLFDAWPRTRIIDALAPEIAQRIPSGFQPIRVEWQIPPFLLTAMGHQARTHAAPSLDDYIADVLFNEIQPETIAALAADTAFLQAYYYPSAE